MNHCELYPLHWIPEFIDSIRPYIHLRSSDNLLILLPNQGYKLNSSAVSILGHVLEGKPLEQLTGKWHGSETVQRDIYYFFCDMRALVAGHLGDGRGRKAVEQVAYTTPFSSLPVLSEIALTYRCNLACRFCYAGCNCRKSEAREKEMTTDEAKEVLRIIREEADVPSVSFTGGEPTLRPDLPALIGHARALGMRVNLITNGTRITDKFALELKEAGLNSAQVSIEGPDAVTHDRLTSVPGSFKRTWRGIDALMRSGITTQTNTTLNAVNASLAVEIVDLLAERGLTRFAMNMLTPSGSAMENGDLAISYSEIGAVVTSIQQRAKQRGLEFFWYSPTPYCLFNPITNGLGNKSCAACDGLLSVNPTGEILPCSSFERGVGNILSGDFRTIWDSARAAFWRNKEYAPAQCESCDTFNACAGACPLYWEARGTAELDAKECEVAL